MTVRAMIDIHDLIASGRLPLLASNLGCDMGNALLALSFVYSATQDAEMSETTHLQLRSLVRPQVAAHCRGIDADRILAAMADAELADEKQPGVWEIRGNRERIDALRKYHDMKRAAGKIGGRRSAEARARSAADRVIDSALSDIKQEKIQCFPEADLKQTSSRPQAKPTAVAVAVEDLKEPSAGNAGSVAQPAPMLAIGAIEPFASTNPKVLALESIYLRKRPGSLLTRLPPTEREALEQLCFSTADPEAVLVRYLADERDYYKKRKWPISALLRDLVEHASANGDDDGARSDFLPRKGSS